MKKYRIGNFIIKAKDAMSAYNTYNCIKDSIKVKDAMYKLIIVRPGDANNEGFLNDLFGYAEKHNLQISGNRYDPSSFKVKGSENDIVNLVRAEPRIRLGAQLMGDSVKDERLSPSTYRALKQLGVNANQWKNWTQEQASAFIKAKQGQKAKAGQRKQSSGNVKLTYANYESLDKYGDNDFSDLAEYMKNNNLNEYYITYDNDDAKLANSVKNTLPKGLNAEVVKQSTTSPDGDKYDAYLKITKAE